MTSWKAAEYNGWLRYSGTVHWTDPEGRKHFRAGRTVLSTLLELGLFYYWHMDRIAGPVTCKVTLKRSHRRAEFATPLDLPAWWRENIPVVFFPKDPARVRR